MTPTQADREAAEMLMELADRVDLHCDDFIEAAIKIRLAAEAAAFEKAACVLEQAIGDGYEVPAVKGDQCVHGRFGWEDCIACYDEELLRTATAIRSLAGEKHD